MAKEKSIDYIAHVRKNGGQQTLREHLRGVGEKASSNAAKVGLAAQGELILPKLFENDASSARPEGSMEILKVVWWQHLGKSGLCSSAKMHRSVLVDSHGNVTVAEIEGLPVEIINGF